MTVIFAALHGVNGFAYAFDMGRPMGDCFRESYAALNGRLWPGRRPTDSRTERNGIEGRLGQLMMKFISTGEDVRVFVL